MRELRPMEPWCLQCKIDLWTGKSYCDCGLTYEERLASKWKLNGEKSRRKPKEKLH